MVEIGGQPILWHIMKHYAQHGLTEFIICLGYRGDVIKDYFARFFLRSSDVTIDLATGEVEVHGSRAEPWRVTLVDTGHGTLTGGRIKRALEYVGDEPFCLTGHARNCHLRATARTLRRPRGPGRSGDALPREAPR
jgi:glucose-1-phosphate cytidylyltransferase